MMKNVSNKDVVVVRGKKYLFKPGQEVEFDVSFKQAFVHPVDHLIPQAPPDHPEHQKTLRSCLDDLYPVIDRLEAYAGALRSIRASVSGCPPENVQGVESSPVCKPVTIMDVVTDLRFRLVEVTDLIEILTKDLHENIG